MKSLHSHITLLILLPAASSFLPKLNFGRVEYTAVSNTKFGRVKSSLSLGFDPTEIASHHNQYHALVDIISTTFSPSQLAIPSPNQSVPPLAETIKSGILTIPNEITIIPDMTSMPGGAPRSGNPFLTEAFRDLFNGPIKSTSMVQPNYQWNSQVDDGSSVFIPAKEFDLVGRYADLLNRIPLAAAVYALVDFFLINSEEDVSIAELLDEEGEEIMDVEGSVVKTRFMGLFFVVLATVVISNLTYHPVPFREL